MFKARILFVLFLWALSLSGQTAISGYINLEEDSWEPKVYLSKVSLEEDSEHIQELAWSPISKDGTFSFKNNYISDKDAIYRLYVERVEEIIKDTITSKKDFIISRRDQITFPNGLTAAYKTSSIADSEWLKLKRFQQTNENKESAEDTLSEAYAAKLKAYTKDSLKILLVKLIGIQQLAKKGLLDRDIAKNQDYYLKLLAELKESDMQPAEYQFLSRRLAYLTQDVVTEKYKRSKAINILLIIIVAGLSVFVYRLKKRQSYIPIGLSKQEKNVQSLILEGKSNKEIANELFISLSTVKTHITNIYGKLKVANRSELIRKTNNS